MTCTDDASPLIPRNCLDASLLPIIILLRSRLSWRFLISNFAICAFNLVRNSSKDIYFSCIILLNTYRSYVTLFWGVKYCRKRCFIATTSASCAGVHANVTISLRCRLTCIPDAISKDSYCWIHNFQLFAMLSPLNASGCGGRIKFPAPAMCSLLRLCWLRPRFRSSALAIFTWFYSF